MAGVNKAIILGNLGKDPEVRSTQNGTKVCSFSLATSERWRDKRSGDMSEKTEWHRIVIFNDGLVDVAEKYLRKGSKVYVEGKLQTRKWQDKDGSDRYTTEIVLGPFNSVLTLLDARRDSEEDEDQDSDPKTGRSRDELDDEIPF